MRQTSPWVLASLALRRAKADGFAARKLGKHRFAADRELAGSRTFEPAGR